MKILSGHLTPTNIKHIKAMLKQNFTEAKVNTINYKIEKESEIYKVTVIKKDNNVSIGDKIQKSKSTFKL